MIKTFFITGTNTHVGKTRIAVALLQYFSMQGCRTLGIKPVASGAYKQDDHFVNEDAIALSRASSVSVPYGMTNPILLQSPIAPHIAAKQEGRLLSVESVMQGLVPTLAVEVDVRIIEGAGGWMVPLNERESMPDLVRALQCPVILVVGMTLGCLNHAQLTLQAIQASGALCVGWIANCIDPNMLVLQENIDTLRERLTVPCLGVTDYGDDKIQFYKFNF